MLLDKRKWYVDVRLLLSLGQRFLFWMLIFYYKVICQLVRIFFVKTVLQERSVKTACRKLGELVCCAGILDHETYGGLGRANLSQNGRPFTRVRKSPLSRVDQTRFNIFKRPYYEKDWYYKTLSRNSIVMVPCETSIIAEQDAVIFVT